MKKLLYILKQPYPYYTSSARTVNNATWIFIFVLLFLFLFSPFGINKSEDKYSYVIICLAHAICAAAIYAVFVSIYNAITHQSKKEENWKVYKAILLIAATLFFIGLGSFFIRPLIYNNPNNFSWRYFFEEVINTFLAGTLIFGIFTLIDFYRLLKDNRSNAAVLEKNIEQHHIATAPVTEEKNAISFTIENEKYELNVNEFLFAKADGNYVTFYQSKNSSIIKDLKRTTLKNIEGQIDGVSSTILRVHRAYIINVKQVTTVTGNAQGYLLSFQNVDMEVPVSRGMIPAFKAVMNSI